MFIFLDNDFMYCNKYGESVCVVFPVYMCVIMLSLLNCPMMVLVFVKLFLLI